MWKRCLIASFFSASLAWQGVSCYPEINSGCCWCSSCFHTSCNFGCCCHSDFFTTTSTSSLLVIRLWKSVDLSNRGSLFFRLWISTLLGNTTRFRRMNVIFRLFFFKVSILRRTDAFSFKFGVFVLFFRKIFSLFTRGLHTEERVVFSKKICDGERRAKANERLHLERV